MLPGIDSPNLATSHYVPNAKFTIGHFGSLSGTRNLVPFIAALEQLLERRPDLVAATELRVYGGPLDAISKTYLAKSSLKDHIKHFGRLEADPETGLSGRTRVLKEMRTVDVLLLLHGIEPICAEYIPSKLYEYLWMQRPILALVHDNPQMLDLLQKQGHTAVPTGGNASAWMLEFELALEHLFDRWESGGCDGIPDTDQMSPYSTQASVKSLLGWVQELEA
jgi:glycosyltransferase involved in cell wall biosynthesis